MKKFLLVVMCNVAGLLCFAQTVLQGVVIDETSNNPISNATVTLVGQTRSTQTDSRGQFIFTDIKAGDEEVTIEANGYVFDIKLVNINEGEKNEMDPIGLKVDISQASKDEFILNISDEDLNDDEGRSQSQASSYSDGKDVFNTTTSYAWSTARWRKRGYEQQYETNYINGLNFNTAERGVFSYSSLGGLNDATRTREQNNPMMATNFTFGSISNSTNYLIDASLIARGWKIGVAGTNRNYKAAVRATYATGILNNGWAFATQLAFRFSPYIDKKGIIGEGTDYYSLGYFFSATKNWDNGNKLNIITFGAPTQRGQSGAVTQEVYDLAGSIYYNPYWGYQNGKMRNYRIIKSFDPTVAANMDLNLGDNHKLNIAIGYHYAFYSNSGFLACNAPDARPDYYRSLASFLWDGQIASGNSSQLYDATTGEHYPWGNFIGANLNTYPMGAGSMGDDGWELGPTINNGTYNTLVNYWKSRDASVTQINWDNIYAANYSHPDLARYILQRMHNDIQEAVASVRYTNTAFNHLKMLLGIEAKAAQGLHYKTLDDMLGAERWIDIDAFADRDIKDLASNVDLTTTDINFASQNDVRYYLNEGQSKEIKQGDVFGYDYQINAHSSKVWFQNEWDFNRLNLFYAIQLTYTYMQRTTDMLNGRAWYQALTREQSGDLKAAFRYFGKEGETEQDFEKLERKLLRKNRRIDGKEHHFADPAFKFGVAYKIDGRNRLNINGLAQTEAPLARNAYVSQRVHDIVVDRIYDHDEAKNLKDFYRSDKKIVSGDLSYEFNYPVVRGRLTGYYTRMWDGTELNGYYDDEVRTFVNQAITGVNQRHCGVEAAVSVNLGTYFTLTGVANIADNRYTSNAFCLTSAENGMALAQDIDGKNIYETRDSVLIKGLKVPGGPQLNASLKLSFFHPKMWFADITVSYHDWNYLGFAPSRRMKGLFYGYRADGTPVNGWYGDTYANAIKTTDGGNIKMDAEGNFTNVQTDANGVPELNYPYSIISEQETLSAKNVLNRFLIDVSVGKLIYLKNRQSLSINLSITNLGNNTHFKTGGYQQSRLPRVTRQGVTDSENSVIAANAWKYPSKYYYAWGTNFYLTLTYKF